MSTRLIQKLLQEIETTFTALLNRECLALAAHMLCTQPQRAVSEVALCSGFNDIRTSITCSVANTGRRRQLPRGRYRL